MIRFQIHIYFFVLIVLIQNSLCAQDKLRNGFIIKNNNDTIYGLIKYKGESDFFSKCEFKKGKFSAPIVYKPDEIIGYGFQNGRLFLSNKYYLNLGDSVNFFSEAYIIGKISFLIDKKNFYLVDDSSKISVLKNTKTDTYVNDIKYVKYRKEYIASLNIYLKDCNSYLKITESTTYFPRSISKSIQKYYKCTNEDYELFYNPSKIIEKRIGFGIGVGQSRIQIKNFYQNYPEPLVNSSEIGTEYFIGPRLFYNTMIPRINEKFTLQLEAMYNKYFFQGQNPPEITDIIYNVNLSFSMVDVSLLVKYTYPLGLFNIGIYGGPLASYIENLKFNEIAEYISGNEVYTSYNPGIEYQNLALGYNYGIGLNYILTNRNNIFVDLKVNKVQTILDKNKFNSSMTNLFFNFGISHLLNR